MSQPAHAFGLCMYGIQYLTGAAGRGTPKENPKPLTAWEFMELAAGHRLASIEVPLAYVSPALDQAELREYARVARDAGLEIVVAGPNITTATNLPQQIELAAAIGSTRFRCTGSGLLCGDRGPVGGWAGWQAHLEREIAILRDLAPLAESLGVNIGIENHQDHDSDDLLRLCEAVGSPNVGVTLDAGNPLSVGEDPVTFAERLLPHLVNIHLKDYRVINTPEGFRLVHCAIGEGVVDFAALWPIFNRRPEIPRGIEMAALSERHVRLFTDDWWTGYGMRDARTLVPALKIVRDRGEWPDSDASWQTPLERDGPFDARAAVAWETERLESSVRSLAKIERAGPAQ